MSDNIRNWKTAVLETREAHATWCELASSQDSDPTSSYIAALEMLCAAYEDDRRSFELDRQCRREIEGRQDG